MSGLGAVEQYVYVVMAFLFWGVLGVIAKLFKETDDTEPGLGLLGVILLFDAFYIAFTIYRVSEFKLIPAGLILLAIPIGNWFGWRLATRWLR